MLDDADILTLEQILEINSRVFLLRFYIELAFVLAGLYYSTKLHGLEL